MSAGLSRRDLMIGSAASAFAFLLPAAPARAAAWKRYAQVIVVDGLGSPGGDGSEPDAPLSDAEIADVRASGLTCVHITVGAVGTSAPDTAFTRTMRDLDRWESEIDRHPEVFTRIRSAPDFAAAKAAGRTGLLFGFQDGVAFETDLSRLENFHRHGVRIIQPTYNRRNLLGDGCMEPANAGLSRAGVEAIERMNALGILVDLSHCGRQTAADAIRVATRPVAFTHTGCAAVIEHPRHRTDAELRAVADKGGLVGIYVMPYLSGGRQPTGEDVVRHLEHALNVAGEEHVAIGTDGGVSPVAVTDRFKEQFAASVRARRQAGIAAPGENETGYLFAADLNTPRRLEMLAAMLSARGHGDARIEKILGSNFVRVMADAWKS